MEIEIHMRLTEPTINHSGWVWFELIDSSNQMTSEEIYYLSGRLTESDLIKIDPRFEGYDVNGGIYEYNRDFGRMVFLMKIS